MTGIIIGPDLIMLADFLFVSLIGLFVYLWFRVIMAFARWKI